MKKNRLFSHKEILEFAKKADCSPEEVQIFLKKNEGFQEDISGREKIHLSKKQIQILSDEMKKDNCRKTFGEEKNIRTSRKNRKAGENGGSKTPKPHPGITSRKPSDKKKPGRKK